MKYFLVLFYLLTLIMQLVDIVSLFSGSADTKLTLFFFIVAASCMKTLLPVYFGLNSKWYILVKFPVGIP